MTHPVQGYFYVPSQWFMLTKRWTMQSSHQKHFSNKRTQMLFLRPDGENEKEGGNPCLLVFRVLINTVPYFCVLLFESNNTRSDCIRMVVTQLWGSSEQINLSHLDCSTTAGILHYLRLWLIHKDLVISTHRTRVGTILVIPLWSQGARGWSFFA